MCALNLRRSVDIFNENGYLNKLNNVDLTSGYFFCPPPLTQQRVVPFTCFKLQADKLVPIPWFA